MKTLRALVLALALSVCAYAGNMGNGVTEPPPPPSLETATLAADGQIHTTAVSTDLATEITLNLLQSVLSLL
jgi:hypothetical protein